MRKALCVLTILIFCVSFISPAFPQDDSGRKIIKEGLIGAGVGAISASASGGKAGKGALIGAGTNIVGNALFDAFTNPSQTPGTGSSSLYDQGYQEGYKQGYRDGYGFGYQEGFKSK